MVSKETIDKITPYAFSVSDELLNIPLARPWRRGVAMAIDLLLIVMLAELPLWALMVALGGICVVGIRQARRQKRGVERWLPWLLVPALLVMSLVALDDITRKPAEEYIKVSSTSEQVAKGLEALSHLPAVMETRECSDLACWQPHRPALAAFVQLADSELSATQSAEDALQAKVAELLEESQLSIDDRQVLTEQLLGDVRALQADTAEAADAPEKPRAPGDVEVPDDDYDPVAERQDGQSEESYKPLRWMRGFFEELGLGFGWAAFYFTTLTAWLNGQTLGKKLMRIQVVQLDNRRLSLWDAFGRYGGYGAGMVTGLMGFLQIYWDPNRQAIQDKVSSTVVIDRGLWLKQQAGLKESAVAPAGEDGPSTPLQRQ